MRENAAVSIRALNDGDAQALRRLAELEGRPVPPAPLLGAEVEGRLLAAISLRDGEALADPFRRTSELLGLLQVRAGQLRVNGRRRLGLRPRPGRPARTLTAAHQRAV